MPSGARQASGNWVIPNELGKELGNDRREHPPPYCKIKSPDAVCGICAHRVPDSPALRESAGGRDQRDKELIRSVSPFTAVAQGVFLQEVKGLFFKPAVVSELNHQGYIAEPLAGCLQVVGVLLRDMPSKLFTDGRL